MPRISALDMPDVPKGQLPSHIELQRTRVLCGRDAASYTESLQYSGAYSLSGVDNSLRMTEFCKNFRLLVRSLDSDDIEFDIVGIDAALANAFRRILIAEIPTMAIEKVFISNNTSVIQDEVLAHRLGLIPIKVDPRLFEYKSENDLANEKNTIVFKLNVVCTRQDGRVKNATVRAEQLQWLPNGSEYEVPSADIGKKTYTSFSCSQDTLPALKKDPIIPRYLDITLARLRPGQCIELEAHAVKGMGRTHAKWSPVATAKYKMLPEVVLLEDLYDDQAEELVQKCPVNVFDIEDLSNGRKKAVVARPRDCTLCRECVMGEGWDKRVQLRRVKEHFIFSIESTGALPPEVLFVESVKVLEEKCQRILSEICNV